MFAVFGVLLLCTAVSGGWKSNRVPRVHEVTCTGGREVLMEVEAADVVIKGVVQFQSRVYRVDGEITFPPTTIRMQAGEVCNLRVVNKLKGPQCTMVDGQNGFHCPDITSLHTHGLHVSPQEDNIDTHIQPGQEHTYTYTVPGDHLMGTHWYHAHHHGSTSLQALGGLAGILLTDPAPSYKLPRDLRRLYRKEKVPPLILNYLALGDAEAGGFWDFFTHKDLVEEYDPVTVPLNLKWARGRPLPNNGTGIFYVVNGAMAPKVMLADGDATLLRMVHAGDGSHLALELDDPEGLCTMTLLARDGVFHQTPYLKLTTIVLLQATRVDVAVQCNLPKNVVFKTINMRATTNPAVNPAERNTFSQDSIMRLCVKKRLPWARKTPVPTSQAPFPEYLASLMNVPVQVGGETGVSTISLRGGGTSGFSVNGVSWPGWDHVGKGKYTEEFCLNKAYEITLGRTSSGHNADGPVLSPAPFHPYHQHINHFQIYEGVDNTGAVMRKGEWRDSVPAWGVVVRMMPVQYEGEAVLHCHLLQHEDNGMMSLMKLMKCNDDNGVTLKAFGETVKDTTANNPNGSGQDVLAIVVLSVGSVVGAVLIGLFVVRRYGTSSKYAHMPSVEGPTGLEEKEGKLGTAAPSEGTVLV